MFIILPKCPAKDGIWRSMALMVFCGTLSTAKLTVSLPMASSATTLSQNPFSSFSRFPQTLRRNPLHLLSIKAVKAAEPDKTEKLKQTKTQESTNATQPSTTTASKPPKKPVYSMKKGQIVRVEKEKYLNSVNYLSVGHPPYYKGLDYIYEDRGEVAWVGVPTAPAWLPTEMLIKSEKLNYERL
ncbi:NAD(P)H:plastoquinone dehydrogenase complex subunit O [Prunus dulcis]|uniref:NAD(P)H:plastoquinone dehydrogenase complex subunit O n=1 Tax=Prunus dulcis TaxID=3755 RepID=A0A5H2XKE6_PRUDU|nr:NAD(P)H:plastoquinone dehydrogenase complex subunit O [Prunus dulcis]